MPTLTTEILAELELLDMVRGNDENSLKVDLNMAHLP